MTMHQLAQAIGLPYADKTDARSLRRREARADKREMGKAAAAANRARQRAIENAAGQTAAHQTKQTKGQTC